MEFPIQFPSITLDFLAESINWMWDCSSFVEVFDGFTVILGQTNYYGVIACRSFSSRWFFWVENQNPSLPPAALLIKNHHRAREAVILVDGGWFS